MKKIPSSLILSLLTGMILIWLSPQDKSLGQVLKLIYLHGALINTGLFLFAGVGLVSMISIFRKSSDFSLLFAIEKTGIIFWITATITGTITSGLAWGGIFWGEPRLQAMILISLISISIYFLSTASERTEVISLLGMGLSLSVWILIIRAGRIMHPDNPFGVSELSIRGFFVAITFVFLAASILTVRWLTDKRIKSIPRPES